MLRLRSVELGASLLVAHGERDIVSGVVVEFVFLSFFYIYATRDALHCSSTTYSDGCYLITILNSFLESYSVHQLRGKRADERIPSTTISLACTLSYAVVSTTFVFSAGICCWSFFVMMTQP